MVAAVETIAYEKSEVPWHGLGNPVSNDLSPLQMLKAAGINWTVSKQGMFLENGSRIPDKYALVRDKDDRVLSVVGTTYKPVQNADAIDFFKKFVKAGNMTMETAGSLWGGRYVWALAKFSRDFKLGKAKDEVRSYLLMSSPHIHGKSLLFQTTAIRVVCWNTFTMSIGSNLRGDGTGFRLVHSTKFDDKMKEQAAATLGIASNQMDDFKEKAELLAKVRAKPEDVEEYFFQVLKFDPEKAKKNKDGSVRLPRALPKFQAALEQAPGADLGTAMGTWWGAFNAITYVYDHETGRTRDNGLTSAWFGDRALFKKQALKIALEKAS